MVKTVCLLAMAMMVVAFVPPTRLIVKDAQLGANPSRALSTPFAKSALRMVPADFNITVGTFVVLR